MSTVGFITRDLSGTTRQSTFSEGSPSLLNVTHSKDISLNLSASDIDSYVRRGADLHLVLLRSGLAKSSTPSKLYSILAAGRPVLASVDEGCEVASVVKECDVGRAVPPEDEWVFCQTLEEMHHAQRGLKVEPQRLQRESRGRLALLA